MRVSAQVSEAADQPEVLGELTNVPSPSHTVCSNCHTWKTPEERWCENCEEVYVALGTPPLRPSFVTLYAKPSRLRDWLTRYKGRPGDEDPWEREAEEFIGAIAARFIVEHGARLTKAIGPFDELIVVPSTNRPPPHPLQLLVAQLGLDVPVSPSLHRTEAPIGFRQPNADAYRADGVVEGRRVLLMDDVYTTGAHLNSAAAALRNAGADVAGALVLARRINPAYRDEARDLWQEANRSPFAWTTGPYVAGANT